VASASLAMSAPAFVAVAAPAGEPVPVVEGLRDAWPQFAVGSDGDVYVAEWEGGSSDAYTITRYEDGIAVDVAARPQTVRGLSAGQDVLTWLEGGVVYQRASDGTVAALADVKAYEEAANPDAGRTYGLRLSDLDAGCAELVRDHSLAAPRPAGTESHAVATATTRSGVYVADYRGGTVLHVALDGTIRTVAVLPVATVTIDADVAFLNDLPECTIGARWDTQRQPTDVEVGPRGELYVYASGSVTHYGLPGDGLFRLALGTRGLTELASGFEYGASIAVAPNGAVYVAHGKFGETLQRVDRAGTVTLLQSPGFMSGIEWVKGRLYAGLNTDTQEPGSIVAFSPVLPA
jgi:hypothetical protein